MSRPTETPQQAARRLAASAIRDGYKPEALHVYTEPDGYSLYWRIRLKHPETGEKWIRPMRLNGAGLELGEPDFPDGKPLYRLHDIATRPEETVWLVEGEWCADALAKAGVLATTSGAADSAAKADWRPLAGRDVSIWPDHDEAGQRYATEAAERLLALGCTVRVIDVEKLGLPKKGDAVDWLAANPAATVAEIVALPTVKATNTRARETNEQAIARLASMKPMDYDRVRQAEADALGVRVSTLDAEVEKLRRKLAGDSDDVQGDAVLFPDIEPWSEQVNGAELLGALSALFKSYTVLPEHAAAALSLWVVFTHAVDYVDVAPILALTSPQKRCGKSTVLALLARLVPRPLPAANISSAALFRAVECWAPTLLIDEADAFLRGSDELRGIINSGHTRDLAFVIRTVGDDHEPRRFSTWGAKAIALIGALPDTLADRTVEVPLQRKLPSEHVEKLRHADPETFTGLARRCVRWAVDNDGAIRAARPSVPDALNDRAQDSWAPLLSIADLAGGDWPRLARAAALALSGVEDEGDNIRVQLLFDIRDVFEKDGGDRMSSEDLTVKLVALEDRPWSECSRGKPLTKAKLARLLRPFGVVSGSKRFQDGPTLKGYSLAPFADAFKRYLPPLKDPPSEASQDPPSPGDPPFKASHRHNPGGARVSEDCENVTEDGCDAFKNGLKPSSGAACDVVTFQTPLLARGWVRTERRG